LRSHARAALAACGHLRLSRRANASSGLLAHFSPLLESWVRRET
jgi:hypothetical protein